MWMHKDGRYQYYMKLCLISICEWANFKERNSSVLLFLVPLEHNTVMEIMESLQVNAFV